MIGSGRFDMPSPEDRLRREHGFNYEEAYSVVDYVCNPSNRH
jgi:hypothetical protein